MQNNKEQWEWMCTAQTDIPDTMSAIGSQSLTTESDMEVFEDAIDTTEDMEYDDTVNADSGSHNDNVTVPSFPMAQFRFSMPNASSSAASKNMVRLSY